ncbi:MAG TPA: SDR family NAD(P)-dependent oxidoreductase [Paracoccaceae bacterium]|nr:SDR family NAD(P)-dependent oxidoreductase [Paracoccaceae bacterium]
MSLAGQVAVVTGAARGIGRAIAGRLAAGGARGLGADLAAVEAPGVESVRCDVTDETQVEALAARAVALGSLDVLVNNAGVISVERVEVAAAAWLVSDEAGYVSGHALALNGGSFRAEAGARGRGGVPPAHPRRPGPAPPRRRTTRRTGWRRSSISWWSAPARPGARWRRGSRRTGGTACYWPRRAVPTRIR